MISILSHIVEFRNGESGLHVLHISTMTELLLKQLMHKTDRYKLKHSDIGLISTASALHDIGKIAIPEDILNKPGKLTKEEFEIMKTHSTLGAQMLDKLPYYQEEKLVKVAYEICRWHHERYDGKGYPDGLKGEEIPIAAQVVSLADVYDALTSERVYKPAFSHGKAMQMIQNGECGAFNPLLLKCLCEIGDVILKELKTNSLSDQSRKSLQNITEEILQYDELGASERTLRLLEHERTKSEFFGSLSQEIQFEYVSDPPMVLVSGVDAQKLGIDEIVMNPKENEKLRSIFEGSMEGLAGQLLLSTPESPIIEYDCELMINGERRWNRFVCRSMWEHKEPPRMIGCIGKMVDIHKEHTKMKDLQHLAAHDSLTGLCCLD